MNRELWPRPRLTWFASPNLVCFLKPRPTFGALCGRWRSEHGVEYEVTAHTHLTRARTDGPENVLVVEMDAAASDP